MNSIDEITWDLSDLYSGISDPRIGQDIGQLEVNSKDFSRKYVAKIQNNIPTQQMESILDEYASMVHRLRKLDIYAGLEHSTHLHDEAYGTFFQYISTKVADIASLLVFIETDIVALSDDFLNTCISSPDLLAYKHFLERKKEQKKHYLSEDIEKLIQQKALTGRYAFIRLYEQHATSQRFDFAHTDDEKQSVSVDYLLHLLYDPRRTVRKKAMVAVGRIAQRAAGDNSFIYNTLVQDFAIDAKLRHFSDPEDMRHMENELSRSAVDALVSVVTNSYDIVQEYYQFKKEIMGVKELFDYDKYAPVESDKTVYSFEEAREIICSAFQDFSPTFATIATMFFEKKWIDATPREGKRGGGYCTFGVPDSHPYVFVNYHGSIRDVLILAHELGHAIQAWMAKTENILQYDWSLPIAETASVFAEMVVFKALIAREQDPVKKLSFYMTKIEGIFATVFRQVSMYEFERAVHSARSVRELSVSQLHGLWLESQFEMFGREMKITPGTEAYWGLVPHFFHTPFYVYAYAFGQLLTLSLFSLYEHDPSGFVPEYEHFMSQSGAKSPAELIKMFKGDLKSSIFWEQGITEIRSLFEEAKKLM